MSDFKFYPGQMNLNEVNAGVTAFKQNFYPGGTGPNTLGRRFTFSFSDIHNLVKQSGIENNRAVVVIYPGLKKVNGAMEEAYGLRLVTLGAVDNVLGPNVYNLVPGLANGEEGAYPTHEFTGTGIAPVSGDFKTEIANYAQHMRVRRDGSAGSEQAVDYNNNDPKAFHQMWSTNLEALYFENKKALGANDADLKYCLRGFTMLWQRAHDPNQEFFLGPDGYRHSVVFHIEYFNGSAPVDLLDNSTPYGSFVNQGLDKMTYCPPHCKPKKQP